MFIKPKHSLLSSILLAIACDTESPAAEETGDGEDGSDLGATDTEGNDDQNGEDSPEVQDCHEALPKGNAKIGDPCSTNLQCESHVCETFETVTAPGEGICTETPPECRTRIMGTVRDVRTALPVGGADVALLPAAHAAGGVRFAPHLIEETSDAEGHFDTVTDEPIDAFVAVIGLVEADGWIPTTTGLSSPIDENRNYEACFALRDWWTVSESDLQTWDDALSTDNDAAPFLPLDKAWDVVGFVRTITFPSQPVAGAKLRLSDPSSNSVIRYLNEDGTTFNDNETTSNGLFVVLGASAGEQFQIDIPGMTPFAVDGLRSGVFPDALYTMAVWMIPD